MITSVHWKVFNDIESERIREELSDWKSSVVKQNPDKIILEESVTGNKGSEKGIHEKVASRLVLGKGDEMD